MKKVITKSGKIKENIERVKSILKSMDILEDDRKEFLQKHLKELEEQYEEYKKNDEPYYEPNTYEYYKYNFSKCDFNSLKYRFIYEICSLSDEDFKPSRKVKIFEYLIKAYKEADKNKFTIK
jgi:DNA repair exonuclease SbcCD ATPase subunit